MARIELHPDFKDFLRLLSSHNVKYLLVGGYAVGYHGYPRATGDMDIWIEMSKPNSKRIWRIWNIYHNMSFNTDRVRSGQILICD